MVDEAEKPPGLMPCPVTAIATNSLSGGMLQFTDPGWNGAAGMLYRLKVP